jgi:excisionase family DNA binding protein
MQEYDNVDVVLARLNKADFLRIFHGSRWPEGILCPRCNKPQHKIYTGKPAGARGGQAGSPGAPEDRSPSRLEGQCLPLRGANRGRDGFRYHCEPCKIWFSDFTGTALANSRLNLGQWLRAIHCFLNLSLTCADVADKLHINRNTAQYLRDKIRKNEPWCKLWLQRTTSHPASSGAIVPLMSLPEVERYLGVSSRTIYRLASSGVLSATKVGRQWRFRPDEVQKYLTRKLNRYGTTAIKENIFFRPEVLDKYRQDKTAVSPANRGKTKYYIEDEAYQGWVGNKEDFNYMQKVTAMMGRGERETIGLSRVAFYHVHYRKVVTPEGHPALAIHHKDYESLPSEEYAHWSNYQIWDKR